MSGPGGCLLQGGVCSQGVSAVSWGVSAFGGCLFFGGMSALSWGVSAPGGCLLPGDGIPAYTEADTHPHCEQNDRQL